MVSGIGVAYAGAGAVLLWSGLKNTTLQETLKAFLKGSLPAPNLTGPPTVGVGQAGAGSSGSPGSDPAAASLVTGALSAVTGTGGTGAAAHQALAKAIAVAAGHPSWVTGQQWQDWVSLWNRESGWSNTADTRKSGLDPPGASVFAYGIPQARPYSKMPKPAWPPDKGGSADAAAQIAWGVEYIASRYGSPSSAWATEQAQGSY